MGLDNGSRIGPYEVLSRLGAGGMGEVYRARDTRLGREVAVKVLSQDAAADDDRLRRFISEAKTVSALNHPNILTLHEIGESPQGPYLVTEVVEGETIRQRMARQNIPLSEALDLAAQTADGLAKAHEAGIIHRDIKPENLMLTRDGYVKILDFGLAKLRKQDDSTIVGSDPTMTAAGILVGTPAYMSPEQLHGLPADARSDLFALGVVLYEMVGGRNPFRRDSAAGTLNAILSEEPPALDSKVQGVPRDVAEIVRKLTAKDPVNRPRSARDVAASLRAIRAGVQSGVVMNSPPANSKRRMFPIAIAAGGMVTAAIFSLLVLRPQPRAGNAELPQPPNPPGTSSFAMPASHVDLPEGRLGVAVLPIRDESGDPQLAQAGIGRILTDAFVQVLSDISGFYVASPLRLDGVARGLGRPFSDTASDLEFARKVCNEANANVMLSGTLGRLGSTYVLHAQLTDLKTEQLLESFQTESKSVNDILMDMTKGVTERLQSKYGKQGTETVDLVHSVATVSMDAYTDYVRASEYIVEGNWEQAIPLLAKAVDEDPTMAVAWSELACAYSFAGDEPRAIAAARKANSLLDHVNAKERRWIELNSIWVETGNAEQYRAAAKQYVQDYPDERQGYFYAGLGEEYLANDPKAAIEFYEQAYNLTPNYYPITKALVDCYLKLNRKDQAIASLERYISMPMAGDHGKKHANWRLEELRKTS
jgi:serine/threonine protein kinase/tetratricopeptide (TPR) repeat protein